MLEAVIIDNKKLDQCIVYVANPASRNYIGENLSLKEKAEMAIEVRGRTGPGPWASGFVFGASGGVDGEKVYLGYPQEVLDEDGDPIKDKVIEGKKFSELNDEQKQLPIAYLGAKSNRDKSGELFYAKNLGLNKKRASVLKRKLEE